MNERGPAFSRHYSSFLPSSPFPFLASVDNKMILRITDGAVKKDLSIFDVNWTCEGLLEIVFESCDSGGVGDRVKLKRAKKRAKRLLPN